VAPMGHAGRTEHSIRPVGGSQRKPTPGTYFHRIRVHRQPGAESVFEKVIRGSGIGDLGADEHPCNRKIGTYKPPRPDPRIGKFGDPPLLTAEPHCITDRPLAYGVEFLRIKAL
jgi:hypothetical protein